LPQPPAALHHVEKVQRAVEVPATRPRDAEEALLLALMRFFTATLKMS
jgi:hypothetical protein